MPLGLLVAWMQVDLLLCMQSCPGPARLTSQPAQFCKLDVAGVLIVQLRGIPFQLQASRTHLGTQLAVLLFLQDTSLPSCHPAS